MGLREKVNLAGGEAVSKNAGTQKEVPPAVAARKPVPPAMGPLSEPLAAAPPAAVEKPAAPSVPVSSPPPATVQPARAPAPKASKPPVVPKAPSAAPAAAPKAASAAKLPPPMPAPKEEIDPDAIVPSSGELEFSDSGAAPAVPPSAPKQKSPLADLDPASLVPREGEGAEENEPAPAKAPAARAPAPVVRTRKWAFDADKDEGKSIDLVSGYSLKYIDKGAGTLQFKLKGKETQPVELGLDESKTLQVDSPDGPLSITVKNKGLNSEGNMEIEVSWEGGKTKAAKTAAKAKSAATSIGKRLLSGLHSHNAEITALTFGGAAPPIAYYLIGGQQLREAMGPIPYIIGGVGVAVVSTALAVWQWVGRSKDIREEAAGSPQAANGQKVN